MTGLTRCLQIGPSVVALTLVLSEAVKGQQQVSPSGVTWTDSRVDLIERQQKPGLASGHASRRSEPGQDDNNHLPLGGRRLETLMAPPGETRATSNGRVAGSTFRVDGGALASYPAAPAQDGSEEPPSRRLQDDESCALGGDFTVSSTLYSAANGCYFTLAEEDPYTFVSTTTRSPAVGDRLVMPLSTLFSDNPSYENYFDAWLMVEVYEVSSDGIFLSVECESYELFAVGSHPSDVSEWYCYVAGILQAVSAETFGISCGCGDGATTTTPAPAATAPTPVDADSPEGASGCGGTDPFAIVSAQLGELDGCYQDTGGDDDGDTFFSVTGEKVDGVLAVYPGPFDEQAFDLRWIVGTYSRVAENVTTNCVSDESPSDAHPADATFYCDLTGTGAYTPVSDDQFNIVCGCDATTTNGTTADGTPAPTSAWARGIGFDFATPSPAAADEADTDTTTDTVVTTPSPAGAENAATVATPAPVSNEQADAAAGGTNGGAPVAPAPRAWLLTAMGAAVVMGAVVMGMP